MEFALESEGNCFFKIRQLSIALYHLPGVGVEGVSRDILVQTRGAVLL